MTAPSIKEALEQIIAKVTIDPGDDTVHPDIGHVLARGFHAMGWANPQAASCDMIEAVASALATFQPSGKRREAIAKIIDPVAFDSCTPGMYGLKNQKELETLTMVGPARRIARDKADLILASGLVQDEAAIRADEREKCAKVCDERAVKLRAKATGMKQSHAHQYYDRDTEARVIAAAIRSARDGGAS